MSDDFDWHGPDADSVVVPHQPAIAVYRNTSEQVVIRQRREHPDDDEFVIVEPAYVPQLIAALQREISPPRLLADHSSNGRRTVVERSSNGQGALALS